MNPAVSILIPAYNAAHWITQAIDSALGQGPEVEVIVVDDGSTDATLDRIRAFDGRIRWESVPNGGAPAARNRLLAQAKAPWVQYLDADDYLRPGKVAGQRVALARMDGADVLYGPETIEWYAPQNADGERALFNQEVTVIPEPRDPWALLALWQLPQTGAPLWRRQALLDVGGWREDQPCCQEHELYLRLLMAGKIFAYDPAGGAVYRRFATGTISTTNMARVRAERMKIVGRLEGYLAAGGLLTPERQRAVDQARFDMARSAWSEDPEEAIRLHGAISSEAFQPRGGAAPRSYRLSYQFFGFEASERIAGLRRRIRPPSFYGSP